MQAQRSLVLFVVLLALASGLWVCNSFLGAPTTTDLDMAGAGEVRAGFGDGIVLPGTRPDVVVDEGATSSREELEVDPIIDPEAAAAAAAAAAEPEHESRLTGTVVRGGGTPVVGARVVARKAQPWFSPPADVEEMSSMNAPGPAFEAETDDEGRFVLYDVPAGKLALVVRADGLAPLNRQSLAVPEHEDYDLGSFQLELGIRLAGKVTGARGKGVEGVQVLGAISPDAGYSRLDLPGFGAPLTTTDPEGKFEITSLAPGGWHLIFDAPGYRVGELKGRTEPEGMSDRGLMLALEEGLSIGGNVVGLDPVTDGPLRVTGRRGDDQPSGAADDVKGAERYRPRHAEVLAGGSFTLLGLAPGVQYKLRLYRQSKSDDPAVPGRWKAVRGVDDIDEMAGGREVEFKHRDEATILLAVKSQESGKSLGTFVVYVSGEGLGNSGLLKGEDDEPQHDFPGGAVRYEGLRPREDGSSCDVRVRAEGFADFEKKGVMLRPGQELDLGECELEPAPIGRVRVVDEASGEPVAGARVLVARSAEASQLPRWTREGAGEPHSTSAVRFAETDEEGIAMLTLWKGSICVVRALAEGFQASEEGRLVPPYEDVVDVELTKGGTVTVRIVDGQGAPVAGMYVEHKIDGKNTGQNNYWNPEASQDNKTGESGEVVFVNLPEGKHEFRALEKMNPWGDGGESAGFEAADDLFLSEGEEAVVELRVEARGGLNATIMESGQPLKGALVKVKPVDAQNDNNWWFGTNEDPRTQVSDHAGRVKFAGIKVGQYWLRVSHADRRMVTVREVRIAKVADDLVISLGVAIIEGQAIDENGEGVEGISISIYAKDNDLVNEDMNDYRVRITEDEDGDADFSYDEVKPWSIRTDREGRFLLRGVAPEAVLVVGCYDRYVVGSSVQVGPLGGDEYFGPLEFQVERAGVLRLDLPGVSRQERDKYTVTMQRMVDGEEKEKRNERFRSWRSNLTIQSLRPGTWKLSLRHKSQPDVLLEHEATVRVGKTERVTLQL